MIKAYVEKKDHLKFSLATDGKECFLIVGESARVTIPDSLTEALLYHINLAAGAELKCLYDGKEPKNPLKDLAELEEIVSAQEVAVEVLRAEKETLETKFTEIVNSTSKVETELVNVKNKNLELMNELSRFKKTPEHSEAPEAS
jgi:hypothetical protein